MSSFLSYLGNFLFEVQILVLVVNDIHDSLEVRLERWHFILQDCLDVGDGILREPNVTEAQAKDAVDAIKTVVEDEMPGLKPHFQAVVDIITSCFANTR